MVQYPHTLKTLTVGTDATYVNGTWIAGTPAAEIEEPCRAESSTGDGYLTQADGKRIDFSWVVYFPLSVTKKGIGEKIKIFDGEELIVTDSVKRFSRGQLNARAWL